MYDPRRRYVTSARVRRHHCVFPHVDGWATAGTDSGVMQIVGAGVARSENRSIRVVGCCPQGITRAPSDPPDKDLVDLEPHHNDFVLVPSSEWGGETTTMFTLAAVLLEHIPGVAVLANGGQISMKEVSAA